MQIRPVHRMVICFIAAICIVGCISCVCAEEMTSGIGMLKHRTINGSDYIEKKSITPILILGIDRPDESIPDIPRDNGQADFILLVIIDHQDKVIRQLMIDRDTMADITVTDAFGRPGETANMRICLAHALGSTQKDGCTLMAKAVGNLLDLKIPLYYSIGMDSVGIVNDALGGVRVTFPEDYQDIDPVMRGGTTVVLDSEQAIAFLRGGMRVEDGEDRSRAKRQQVYMSAVVETLFDRLHGDKAFIADMLNALDDVAVTNASPGRLLNEASRAIYYDILPAETLTGEYSIGENGFGGFHVDREAVETWIEENLFEPNC